MWVSCVGKVWRSSNSRAKIARWIDSRRVVWLPVANVYKCILKIISVIYVCSIF